MIRVALLAAVTLLLVPFAANAQKGYKGIPWGTPCGDAVQRLTDLGTTFSRQGIQTTKFENALGRTTFLRGFTTFAPTCEYILSAGIPELEVATGTTDDLTVSAYCVDGKFAAITLSGTDKLVGRTLRSAAGTPQASKKSRINYPGYVRPVTYSRLAPKGDSVRFLEQTGEIQPRRTDLPPTITYEVISAPVAREFTKAIKRCADADAASMAEGRREAAAKRKAIVD